MIRPNPILVLGVLLLGGTVGLFAHILIAYPPETPQPVSVVSDSQPLALAFNSSPESIRPNPDLPHMAWIEDSTVVPALNLGSIDDTVIEIVSDSEISSTPVDSSNSVDTSTPMTNYSASYASSRNGLSTGSGISGSSSGGASSDSSSSGSGGSGGSGGGSGGGGGGGGSGGGNDTGTGGTGTGGGTPSDNGGSIFPDPDDSTPDPQDNSDSGSISPQFDAKVELILSGFADEGQQYVPLGFLGMVEDMRNQAVLTELREHHLNLVHKYSSIQPVDNARLDLAVAEAAGIGVLQNLPRQSLATESPAFWDNHITQLSTEEYIRIWYLPEETQEQDIPRLRQLSRIIRQKDPSHRPIVAYLENCNSGYLRQFTDIVDAIVVGAYPTMTPWRPRADIKCRLEKAQDGGQTPVFAALEALQHDGRWTLPGHIRFDGYLSLLSGAKGIVWYSYNRARQNAELMEAIYAFASEVNGPSQLGQILLMGSPVTSIMGRIISGPQMAPPASAYENRSTEQIKNYLALQWTARRSDNRLYIIAVNMAQTVGADDDGGQTSSIRVRFDNLSTSAAEVEVLFEERTISMNSGSFEDDFQPLGVHIYSIDLTPRNE